MQNSTAVGRLRRLKETKMWRIRDLGLDPGLNSPEEAKKSPSSIAKVSATKEKWREVWMVGAPQVR